MPANESFNMIRNVIKLWSLAAITTLKVAAAISVSQLQCEDRVNPAGMDVVNPQLSWILCSDQRGEKQSAYQILVASSLDRLKGDTVDLWDSGKVLSDETSQMAYQGKRLVSR